MTVSTDSYRGAANNSTHEFKSANRCELAGIAWVQTQHPSTVIRKSYLCVIK